MRSRQGWFTIMVAALIAMVGVGHGVGQQIDGRQFGEDRFGGPPPNQPPTIHRQAGKLWAGNPWAENSQPDDSQTKNPPAEYSQIGRTPQAAGQRSGVVQAGAFGTAVVPDLSRAAPATGAVRPVGTDSKRQSPPGGGSGVGPMTAQMAASLLKNEGSPASPGMPTPTNMGQKNVPQAAAAGDLVCFFGSDGAGSHTIAVVNAGKMQIAVYHIDRSGALRLISSRPIDADFSVTLNATDPLPSQIRHLQSRVK